MLGAEARGNAPRREELDAVQEALIAAAKQWPEQGLPDNPKGWLITVATRRLTDQVRADTARRLREQLVVSLIPNYLVTLAVKSRVRSGDRAGRPLNSLAWPPTRTQWAQPSMELMARARISSCSGRVSATASRTMNRRTNEIRVAITPPMSTGSSMFDSDTRCRVARCDHIMLEL